MKKIAYIFQEVTGRWHYCDASLPYLDARGADYCSKNAAIQSARENGWTHYQRGKKIRKL